jgi:hypothetical protein
VRGTGLDDLLDLRPYTLRILYDCVRPEAYDAPSFAFHRRRPASIGFNLESVMVTIDFDDELSSDAGEICEIRTDRMLSPELGATDAARPQQFPNLAFCTTAVATEFTCSHGIVIVSGHDPLT